MREQTASRVTAADRPYGEFYDFYSVSSENFGSALVYRGCRYTLAMLWQMELSSKVVVVAVVVVVVVVVVVAVVAVVRVVRVVVAFFQELITPLLISSDKNIKTILFKVRLS